MGTSVLHGVEPVSVGRGLAAGVVAGVVAAVAGVLVHLVVTALTGRSYEQLSVVSIPAVTIVASLIGGLVFVALTQWARRPAVVFAVLAALGAVVDTAAATAAGQGWGFVLEAGVLHVVVATVVAVVLPWFALRRG